MPASISRPVPEIREASALTKKAAAAAMSSPRRIVPSGGGNQPSVAPGVRRPVVVVNMPGAVSPGQIALTRTPAGPHSAARQRVIVKAIRFAIE
jgi:hypothetical protein